MHFNRICTDIRQLNRHVTLDRTCRSAIEGLFSVLCAVALSLPSLVAAASQNETCDPSVSSDEFANCATQHSHQAESLLRQAEARYIKAVAPSRRAYYSKLRSMRSLWREQQCTGKQGPLKDLCLAENNEQYARFLDHLLEGDLTTGTSASDRMTNCSLQATDLMGDDRKIFMSTCVLESWMLTDTRFAACPAVLGSQVGTLRRSAFKTCLGK